MKNVFLSISDKITTEVAAVRWVDFDLGQLDQQEIPAVSFPACLISFDNAAFVNLGANGQMAPMTIKLRVAFKLYERTHSKAATQYRSEALEHLDILDAIHSAINNLSGDDFNSLTRMNIRNEKRADLRVYEMTYECMYYDVPDSSYIPVDVASPGLDVDFCNTMTINEI